MAGDPEQTDSSGKYTFGGGGARSVKYWPTILKSIELICCLILLGLIDDPAQSYTKNRLFITQRTICLCYATFATFLIFSITYLIGKVIREEWPWKTVSILACLATFLFLLCGIFLLKSWSDTKSNNSWPPNTTRLDLVCASGIISLITSIVFLFDTILTIRAGNRGEFDEQ